MIVLAYTKVERASNIALQMSSSDLQQSDLSLNGVEALTTNCHRTSSRVHSLPPPVHHSLNESSLNLQLD